MKKYSGELILIIDTLIFGIAYVFQSIGARSVAPFTFVALRFLIGSIIMFPFILKTDETSVLDMVKSSIVLGLLVMIPTVIQQNAFISTNVGKVGFISSLYVIFVPIFNSILFKRRINASTIFATVVALFGLFILFDIKEMSLSINDILLLLIPVAYSLQIIYISESASSVTPYKLAFCQFIGAFIPSMLFAFMFETVEFEIIKVSLFSIIYTGVVSTALGYLLQVIGQSMVESNVASIIFSLESVFSAVAGYLFLYEILSVKEIMGCVIVFMAVMISQIGSYKKSS